MNNEAVEKASKVMQKELDAYKKKQVSKEYFAFMKETSTFLANKERK